MKTKAMKNEVVVAVVVLVILVVLGTVMTSCNVTRSITTSSQYYQRGDTSVVIQTKTIESYDGVKK